MERYFNTEGCCRPKEHYMVKLDDRLEQIKKMYVDRGKYFLINRGRQYGKTTTLKALTSYLKTDYIVLSMDFQIMSTENFADGQTFTAAFTKYMEELVFADERLNYSSAAKFYLHCCGIQRTRINTEIITGS